MVEDGPGGPGAARRGDRRGRDGPDGEAPLLSLFGGKITTYRRLAGEAVAMLKPFLPSLSGGDWTAKAALPGGDFPMQGRDRLIADLGCDYPFLDYASVERIACAYGTRAWDWLDGARDMDGLGTHFGHGLTEAELATLVARGWGRADGSGREGGGE